MLRILHKVISVLFLLVCVRLLPTVPVLLNFIVSPSPANQVDFNIFCFHFLIYSAGNSPT